MRTGKPAGWACGIVYTIGRVNFLSDPAQTPHMPSAAIAKGFGVSEATMMKRSGEIRRRLEIIPLDPEWCTQRMLNENPLVWMAETIEGFIIDLRTAPRDVQAEAFEQGMTPYIPADQGQPALRLKP